MLEGGGTIGKKNIYYFYVSGHLEFFERHFLLFKINNFGGMS